MTPQEQYDKAVIDKLLDEMLESSGAQDFDELSQPISDDPAYMRGWNQAVQSQEKLLRDISTANYTWPKEGDIDYHEGDYP